jgi:hypothetical protein
MPEHPIHDHIEAAATRPARETQRLTSRIVARCWPGGGEDCTQPAALQWLRRWRPATAGAPVPACSCASGHCPVCN